MCEKNAITHDEYVTETQALLYTLSVPEIRCVCVCVCVTETTSHIECAIGTN
jgi:hypothetical protein